MSNKSIATIATMGIDIGKNSFHVVGLDRRGAIVLRQKWSPDLLQRVSWRPCSLRAVCGVEDADVRASLHFAAFPHSREHPSHMNVSEARVAADRLAPH